MLADQGIYVRIDVQNESLGQSIQLRSTDREVITLLAHML